MQHMDRRRWISLEALRRALPKSFVQANAGRNGQIQAAHRAGHRQSDTPIKIFRAYAFWQSSRFGSEYKPISRLEMHLGVQLRGEFSEEPSPIWGHACP
jgi:hypothetical protein